MKTIELADILNGTTVQSMKVAGKAEARVT